MSSELGNKEANFSKVRALVENNIKPNTDIIVLPEVWTVGWKPALFRECAEDLTTGETIKFLSEIAKKYNVNIIGGSFITLQNNIYHNTCPVINRKGKLVATYDKMHLFSYYGCDEGTFVKNGKNPVMVNFSWDSGDVESRETTSHNGVNIGISICYDIRFPEIYRAYRKAGADLLINMAAWPMTRAVHWEALSKARAIENQCFMLALTQSGLIENNEYNLGHSRIIDFNGEVVSEIKNDADRGEGAMFAEIKFDDMYQFRQKCTVICDIQKNYDVK